MTGNLSAEGMQVMHMFTMSSRADHPVPLSTGLCRPFKAGASTHGHEHEHSLLLFALPQLGLRMRSVAGTKRVLLEAGCLCHLVRWHRRPVALAGTAQWQ